MDGIIADLIKETTTTTGTVLNIALAGDATFGRFSDIAVAGQTVYYTIRNGNNSEVGIGTVQAGNTLDRTTPLVTIDSGVYDNTTPTRLNLVGSSTVAISPSSLYLDDLFQNAKTEVGAVEAFANTVPSSFLDCNGAAVSRTTYADLFAYLGTTYGAGDGSTTFNIPDLRGEFIRGFDNGRGADAGRVLGSFQDQSDRNHTHRTSSGHDPTQIYLWADGAGNPIFGSTAGSVNRANVGHSGFSGATGRFANTDGYQAQSGVVRPRNVAMRYGIKY